MKARFKNNNQVRFGELCIGDVFKFRNKYYLKICDYYAILSGSNNLNNKINSVCLIDISDDDEASRSNMLFFIQDDEIVENVNAELYINN